MPFKYKEYAYSDSCVLPSGNTIKIEFDEIKDDEHRKYYYNIYLVTMHKRKSEFDTVLKITGRDGIIGLLWAKQKIVEFENYITDYHKGDGEIVIYCWWEDNRRRKVYEYGLKPLGYKIEMFCGVKQLVKRIK
jgi:hypothetical protein